MDKLIAFITENTTTTVQPESGEVNMVFFGVNVKETTPRHEPEDLLSLLKASGRDGFLTVGEHSYLEIGAYIGDQGLALRMMALGAHMGYWRLLSPYTVLGASLPKTTANLMAGQGLLSILIVE